ncbi:hypothetical protein [Parafrankia sp. EUN1f]|uniref:hypothetical protein n=1 Tax=Parafrankia sp. EUN1f TaxID=102897 RepID=UPI0012FC255A|nr:hypothetical protein [Parafrankia sp. EUN1f]
MKADGGSDRGTLPRQGNGRPAGRGDKLDERVTSRARHSAPPLTYGTGDRVTEPEPVRPVAFLVSPGGAWVTGQSIAASGGAF